MQKTCSTTKQLQSQKMGRNKTDTINMPLAFNFLFNIHSAAKHKWSENNAYISCIFLELLALRNEQLQTSGSRDLNGDLMNLRLPSRISYCAQLREARISWPANFTMGEEKNCTTHTCTSAPIPLHSCSCKN